MEFFGTEQLLGGRRFRQGRLWLACLSPLLLLVCMQGVAEDLVETQSSKSLLDSSHHYLTNRFDGVARWFDGFFGDEGQDRESATSLVRLRYSYTVEEAGNVGDKLRLRGKVDLPQLDRRLKLVFSDEEDDLAAAEQTEAVSERENRDIALQYDSVRDSRWNWDQRVGVRSRKAKVSSRLRFRHPFTERWRVSLSEELFWWDGIGFGSRTIGDIEYIHSESSLTRWRNVADFTEKSDGIDWFSELSLRQAFCQNRAMTYFVRADGHTRPKRQTEDYGLGLTYRQRLHKKWLFAEITPQYVWEYDEIERDREGIASVILRLELMFSEDHKH